jgi:hypothetical protein
LYDGVSYLNNIKFIGTTSDPAFYFVGTLCQFGNSGNFSFSGSFSYLLSCSNGHLYTAGASTNPVKFVQDGSLSYTHLLVQVSQSCVLDNADFSGITSQPSSGADIHLARGGIVANGASYPLFTMPKGGKIEYGFPGRTSMYGVARAARLIFPDGSMGSRGFGLVSSTKTATGEYYIATGLGAGNTLVCQVTPGLGKNVAYTTIGLSSEDRVVVTISDAATGSAVDSYFYISIY